jgi:hypothetical protein
MGRGQEITIQLALHQKPAAFSATDPSRGIIPEALVEALNAVRLHGHSQILVFCNSSCTTDKWDHRDEVELATIIEIVEAMQLEDEEIESIIAPSSVEERSSSRFCCINLRLKK